MNGYVVMAAALAAAIAFFAVQLKRFGQKPAAALALIPCCAFAVALARVGYVLLLQADYLFVWGEWDLLLDMDFKRMCFTVGGFVVWLGLAVFCRLFRLERRRVLDAFAAPGALLVAGLRLAEGQLGMLGAGMPVEGEGLFSGPLFTIANTWGEKYAAVYVWESAVALCICAWALLSRETSRGMRFEKTLFALCLCQLLLENLRNFDMRWGFVHTEQILCAVILMVLMLLACSRADGGPRRYMPALWLLVCMGAVVGEEFARQKGSSQLLADLGYWMMAGILVCMALLYRAALRKEAQSSSAGKESSKGT